MSITDRDKKILAVLTVIAALAGYWFLLLSPKRAEVTKVEGQVASQQQQLDAALAQVQAAETAQASFETDYAEMVRLGKAIPSTVDMPSLLVQLDEAADGARIDVEKITVGARVPPTASAPAITPPAQGEGEAAAAPGGEQAGTAPGQAAETAGETADDLNAQTSENAREGSVPVGGGEGSAPAAAGGQSGVSGLDSVPIEFEISGSFFDLADFFHRLKRFVRLGDDGIVVRGRLMTVDSFSFGAGEGQEGGLKAAVKATVYLAPEAQGATAGATPTGPAPQGDSATASAATPPTATVQP